MNTKHQPGFTVLEFLIVLAIILILIAILLPNLQTARERSVDEKKITDLKSMVLGLEQFKQSCGTYPENMAQMTPCGDTDVHHTLRDYVPEIAEYTSFNTGVDGDIMYLPLASSSSDAVCTGFHIGFKLKNNTTTGIFSNGDSNIDSSVGLISGAYTKCGDATGEAINGTDPAIFDIFR